MPITDTDARSYRKKEFAKALERQMRRRRRISISRTAWKCGRFVRLRFTVSVDGIAGRERLGMGRRGWPPTWPASGIVSVLRCWCMVYYVRVGMAIAVGWSVRTTASSFVAAWIDNDPGARPHPRWGCLRRLADLAGQVKASPPYPPSSSVSESMVGKAHGG
jgi:hypothetical protein